MTNIRCKWCKRDLPVERFHKHSGFKSGYGSKCKECALSSTHASARKYRSSHHKEIVERDRKRWPLRGHRYKARARSRGSDPYKRRCRMTLRDAVKAGKIKKPSKCEECGWQGRLHGHHDDYNKPLEVKWLCPICHGKTHRKY